MWYQNMRCAMIKSIFIVVSFAFSAHAFAEQFSKTQGNYTVHYNVFNSTFISQKVAKQYDLIRSPESFLLNVSVRKKTIDGKDVAHPAKVKAYTNDLMRHHKLSFREIKETGAIYYLADVPVKYIETLKFHINVTPENSREPIDIDFHRKVMPDK